MKSLVSLLSTSSPLYNSCSTTSHLHPPSISMSSNFLGSIITLNSIFSYPDPQNESNKKKLFSYTMAACIHRCSRTEATKTNSNIDDNLYTYVKYCRSNIADLVSCVPFSEKHAKNTQKRYLDEAEAGAGEDELWSKMKDEARFDVQQEPILSNFYFESILTHDSMESALANILSMKLSNTSLPSGTLCEIIFSVLIENQEIMEAVRDDLRAVKERDPACISYIQCLLNFKGFLACQAQRVAHKLWSSGRKILALLIQNRVSEVFAVDIHPGAKIGRGILLDHATGVVVGETAVIGNNVSILHNVTLGGTGKVSGDRHPKIGDGVLIGAATCVLGNVRIGDGAKIGAGSVVLKDVPVRTTAVGNPARLIGGKENPIRLDKIPSFTMDHTSHISEWSDYVI